MKSRRVLIFGAFALLVVAGALWLSAQRQLPRATLAGAPVLPGLAAQINAVDEIRIARGDGTAATLRRQDSGEWRVQERNYAADFVKLRKLLVDAAALAVVEEKTHDPANYAALGVDAPDKPASRGTLLQIRSGRSMHELILGNTSGMKSVFVRIPSAAGSVLATPQLNLDAQPAAWLDRQLFDLPPERIKAVTRRPAPPSTKNAPPPAPDPSFAAFTFDDLRIAAGATPAAQLSIETKDGMIVELAGEAPQTGSARGFVTVSARALEGAEPKVHREASELATRTAGRQFEVPQYRYEMLFPAKPARLNAPARAEKR